jgi:7-cyano-7-deazaguanine synthase
LENKSKHSKILKMKEKTVILFSSGIDSTTALYWALREFSQVQVLIFSYSQKHTIEVEMAKRISESKGIEHHIIELPFKHVIKSALIDEERVIPGSLKESKNESGVPYTYVPFRNGIFLSFAAAYGESRDIYHIVTGFNLIDTPDYPDTTEMFAAKMQDAINQGTSASITNKKFRIHTPLIKKSKKEIIQMGLEIGADYSYSISCYRTGEIPCLKCPSCDIRNNAFRQLKMEDPLITRLKKEGKI